MARLVVALVALAVMSAGSMYWAAAQQSESERNGAPLAIQSQTQPEAVCTVAVDKESSQCPGGCCCPHERAKCTGHPAAKKRPNAYPVPDKR